MTLRYLCLIVDEQANKREYLTRFTLSKIRNDAPTFDIFHFDIADKTDRYFSAIDIAMPYNRNIVILRKYDDEDLLIGVEGYSLNDCVFDFLMDTSKTKKYRLSEKGEKDFPDEEVKT